MSFDAAYEMRTKPGAPNADAADEPDYTFTKVDSGAEFSVEDLVDGDRCLVAQPGDTVYANMKVVNGQTLDVLDSTWANGKAYEIPLEEGMMYGLAQGIIGMGIGGQRLITIPPSAAFGEEGNAQQGLAPETVYLVLVELEGIVGVDTDTGSTGGDSGSDASDTTESSEPSESSDAGKADSDKTTTTGDSKTTDDSSDEETTEPASSTTDGK